MKGRLAMSRTKTGRSSLSPNLKFKIAGDQQFSARVIVSEVSCDNINTLKEVRPVIDTNVNFYEVSHVPLFDLASGGSPLRKTLVSSMPRASRTFDRYHIAT